MDPLVTYDLHRDQVTEGAPIPRRHDLVEHGVNGRAKCDRPETRSNESGEGCNSSISIRSERPLFGNRYYLLSGCLGGDVVHGGPPWPRSEV